MEHYKLQRLAMVAALSLAWPAAQAQVDAEAATAVLPQIEIRGQGLGATTEGTGSYTTGKARTALPLNMALRDTPQSMSVVTQQRIEDQNLVTVTDVVNNVTGVSVNQYESNRAGFTARGFDIDNLQIDGAPATWDQAWSSGEVSGSLATYDRVEVVRGATGLMTGAGNPSAAINLVRKRASSRELTGSADIGIGSWSERRAMADISTPLNQAGTVRARVVGAYQSGDSWARLASKNSHTLYGALDADLGAKTLLSAGYSHQTTDPKGPMWGGLPYWYTDGARTNWDSAKTSAANWSRWGTEYDNFFANLDHEFDNGWKLRASYSHGDRKADSALLYVSGIPDHTTGLGMSAFAGSYQTHTKQDDVNLHAGGPFTLGGRKHEAAFGYLHSTQRFSADTRVADYGPGGALDVGNFNTWSGNYPEPAWTPAVLYDSSVTTQQALYGVARFALADPLKLIVGARLSDYDKTGHGLYTTPYELQHKRQLTPYAGLVYDLNDTYSAYASYTSIFQPQNLKDYGGKMLDPIDGKSAEAGIKGEFFDGRLNASLALFQIRQDKLGQEAGLVDRDGAGPLAPESYYRAAAGATSRGIEFDLAGQLAKGWNANLGYTRFHAEDAAGVDVNSVYPRQLLRLFTTWQLPGDWKALTIGGGVNWEGRSYTIAGNAPANTGGRIEQPAYSLVNLMARYDIDGQWSAQFNLNNALDKRHFGMFAAYSAITYAAPRSAALSLKYRF